MFLSDDFVSEMNAGQMGSLHLLHPSYESNCVDSVAFLQNEELAMDQTSLPCLPLLYLFSKLSDEISPVRVSTQFKEAQKDKSLDELQRCRVYPPDKSQKKPEAHSRSHVCRQESNVKKSKAKKKINHPKCKSPKVSEKASPRPVGSIRIGVNDAVFGRGGEANKLRKVLKLFGSLIDKHSISYGSSDNVEKE